MAHTKMLYERRMHLAKQEDDMLSNLEHHHRLRNCLDDEEEVAGSPVSSPGRHQRQVIGTVVFFVFFLFFVFLTTFLIPPPEPFLPPLPFLFSTTWSSCFAKNCTRCSPPIARTNDLDDFEGVEVWMETRGGRSVSFSAKKNKPPWSHWNNCTCALVAVQVLRRWRAVV